MTCRLSYTVLDIFKDKLFWRQLLQLLTFFADYVQNRWNTVDVIMIDLYAKRVPKCRYLYQRLLFFLLYHLITPFLRFFAFIIPHYLLSLNQIMSLAFSVISCNLTLENRNIRRLNQFKLISQVHLQCRVLQNKSITYAPRWKVLVYTRYQKWTRCVSQIPILQLLQLQLDSLQSLRVSLVPYVKVQCRFFR